jgi:peptide-methionine (S)-S-oxide reductase
MVSKHLGSVDMTRLPLRFLALAGFVSLWFVVAYVPAPSAGTAAPAPARVPVASAAVDTAVFAGGCFWGVEAVFEHLKGVRSAESGYAGGATAAPSYEQVSSGTTGHAESVRVVYDPAQISYGELLQVFFRVAHDPTQLNRQGADRGRQYRSVIFTADEEQAQVARAYIRQLDEANVLGAPIVTEVAPLQKFYEAELYHQDYAARNPRQPYIQYTAAPKVAKLRKHFADRLKR